jgi:hypothetical protein
MNDRLAPVFLLLMKHILCKLYPGNKQGKADGDAYKRDIVVLFEQKMKHRNVAFFWTK